MDTFERLKRATAAWATAQAAQVGEAKRITEERKVAAAMAGSLVTDDRPARS